jgi:hypothetical protein
MKRFVFLLIATLVISGAVWGQVPAPGAVFGDDLFDYFNAVPTVSTESRYSAGTFTSDVDDYISVTDHDPKIGTFFFLGGYPAVEGDPVDNTENLTAGGNPYVVSFGLGKTFNAFYLGVYYGGNFVNATGQNNHGDPEIKQYNSAWRNRLALLINPTGSNIGAFRFDLIMNNTQANKATNDGDITNQIIQNAPAIAFTWGGMNIAGINPYVTLGYKFADKTVTRGITPPGDVITKSNAAFGIQLGGTYSLKDNADISADLAILHQLATDYSGGGRNNSWKEGGNTGFGLKVAYSQTIDTDKVSVGLKPGLGLGYRSISHKTTAPAPAVSDPSDNFFEFTAGIDLGIKYQHNKLFALYSGASLQIFDWVTVGHSGGDTDDDRTGWRVTGFRWDTSKFNTTGNLGFGMTLTPNPNLVIGAGLNTILDRLFYIDLTGVGIGTGPFFSSFEPADLFGNLRFDLTISYKM